MRHTKITLRSMLALGLTTSVALVMFATSAWAQKPGITELTGMKPWVIGSDKQTHCRYTAPLTQGKALEISYDKDSTKTTITFKTDVEQFVTHRLYQTDIYIDYETHYSNNAKPISTTDISLISMDNRRFAKLFNGIEEFSFGLGETLYVVNFTRVPFPFESYDRCVKSQQPQDHGFAEFLGTLNPFALPQEVKEQRAQEKAAKEKAAEDAKKEKAKEGWTPFLTGFRPNPYALKPQDDAVDVEALKEQDKALSEATAFVTEGSSGVRHLTAPEGTSAQSCGPAVEGGVYEFSQIPETELPDSMRGLRDFMTGNDANPDEDKELINSLLVQMELLEKEKEALRLRQPEEHSPLSIIRSCGRERNSIEALKEELRLSEDEKFVLQKRQEIQDDIIKAYEGIDPDQPPPPPTEDSDEGNAESGDDDSAGSDTIEGGA